MTLATETKHRPICQQYCRWDMKVPVQPMACTGPLYPQMSHWVKKLFVQAGVLYGDFHYWQKLYHHMWKIMIIVCESQSAADMSLALFGAMNGWQCVLFLKHELNRVLLVRNNHVYIKKQNNTWGLGEVEFLFEGSTWYFTCSLHSLMRYWVDRSKRNLCMPMCYSLHNTETQGQSDES